MPSNLSSPRTDIRRANLQRAVQLQYLQTLSVRGPFLGIIPDIDPNQLPSGVARVMENLRAQPTPDGQGELLMLPPGYSQIDEANLPLDPDVDDNHEIIMLGQLVRETYNGHATPGVRLLDWDITPLALTAGNATPFDVTPPAVHPDPARLYRIEPTGGAWEEITYTTLNGSPVLGTLCVDRDNTGGDTFGLPHMCTFKPGAPTVDGVTRGYGGAVTQPVAIICDNFDTVKIYPCEDAAGAGGNEVYEDLTDTALAPFVARSCAAWNDRVYFLNTSEGVGIQRFSQRLRRTARGTANPDPLILGSGSTDLNEFQRDGLRIEPMGEDVLAVYFEDGVAFNYKTGLVTSPDSIRVITKERGLMGTHAMCPIGGDVHFGIFNDGWFLLNAEGQWKEVGLANVGETPCRKWSGNFYQNLNYEYRHRLFCYYIKDFNQVAIVTPKFGAEEDNITEIWILDLVSDRVYVDKYDCTVIGGYDLQVVEDIQYRDIPVDGVDDYTDAADAGWTYANIGPQFSLEGMVHGDTGGYVFAHDGKNPRRNGSYNFTWLWEAPARGPGAARYQVTADRIVVEYIAQSQVTATATAYSGTTGALQTRVLDMDLGDPGTVQSTRRYFRFTAPTMGVRLSGQGPVMIRAFDFDVFSPEVEGMRT